MSFRDEDDFDEEIEAKKKANFIKMFTVKKVKDYNDHEEEIDLITAIFKRKNIYNGCLVYSVLSVLSLSYDLFTIDSSKEIFETLRIYKYVNQGLIFFQLLYAICILRVIHLDLNYQNTPSSILFLITGILSYNLLRLILFLVYMNTVLSELDINKALASLSIVFCLGGFIGQLFLNKTMFKFSLWRYGTIDCIEYSQQLYNWNKFYNYYIFRSVYTSFFIYLVMIPVYLITGLTFLVCCVLKSIQSHNILFLYIWFVLYYWVGLVAPFVIIFIPGEFCAGFDYKMFNYNIK